MASIQPFEIRVNGNPVPAYLAMPAEEGPHPGLIVMSEIFGVNENLKNVCMRLADQGYAAATVDDLAGRLAALVKLPVPPRVLVGRVEDRALEEFGVHVAASLSLPIDADETAEP